ncbi:MAG TPA: hypothetical protein VKO85_04885 [Wenzhouxiangellaceae bacterium]|nr:hypothetical protein [Wenzhouxiangellaceae bacterium]
MTSISIPKIAALVAALTTAVVVEPVLAQRAGQSISVQYGVVSGARDVDLRSGAVPTGAVVGGTIGLISASDKRSSKKVRNAVIGSAAGAALGRPGRGARKGMVYSVQTGSAGMIEVVSDQREIRIGDCVAVEQVRDTANVRRVSPAYCNAANEEAVAAVEDVAHAEAEQCQQAKRLLVEAETDEAIELASLKIKLLCAD